MPDPKWPAAPWSWTGLEVQAGAHKVRCTGSVSVRFDWNDPNSGQAIADLVTAAPDLYEALEHAITVMRLLFIETLVVQGVGLHTAEQGWQKVQTTDEYKKYAAALAKARGERAQ